MKHNVSEHKLVSGAQGLLVHVPGAAVYNIVIRFNSGYQFGDFKHYELPHVVEHMVGRGSENYPLPNQFMTEISKNGAYRNANTGARFNGYIVECAAFELDRILDLYEEQLVRPIFPAEALPTELSNIEEELSRSITEHDRAGGIAVLAQAFPQDYMVYEKRIEQLKSITREHVSDYFQRTHTAHNARFYMAGDLPPAKQDAVLKRLEQLFQGLPKGERYNYRELPGRLVPETVLTPRDIKQLYYSVDLYGGGLDDTGRRALKLLRLVLFGGFSSRIYGEARRLGLAYGIGGSASASAAASSLGFSGNVSWERAQPLFELVVREILAVRDEGLRPGELEAMVDLAIGSMDRSYQTAGDLLGYHMGWYDNEGRIVPLEDEQVALRHITPEQVQAAARIAAPGVAHGVSFVGTTDDPRTAALEKTLSRLWA